MTQAFFKILILFYYNTTINAIVLNENYFENFKLKQKETE